MRWFTWTSVGLSLVPLLVAGCSSAPQATCQFPPFYGAAWHDEAAYGAMVATNRSHGMSSLGAGALDYRWGAAEHPGVWVTSVEFHHWILLGADRYHLYVTRNASVT